MLSLILEDFILSLKCIVLVNTGFIDKCTSDLYKIWIWTGYNPLLTPLYIKLKCIVLVNTGFIDKCTSDLYKIWIWTGYNRYRLARAFWHHYNLGPLHGSRQDGGCSDHHIQLKTYMMRWPKPSTDITWYPSMLNLFLTWPD